MATPLDKDDVRDLAKAVGKVVAEKRRSLGFSQEKLAEFVNCHRTYVGIVERGERNITLYTLVSFAAALDCLPSEILKGMKM